MQITSNSSIDPWNHKPLVEISIMKMTPLETTHLLPDRERIESSSHSLPWILLFRFLKAAMILVPILLLITIIHRRTTSVHVSTFVRGSSVHIASSKYNLYLRVNATSVVLTEDIPWLHSSTLEMFNQRGSNCFRLRTMGGVWLRADYSTGQVVADSSANRATSFETVVFSEDKQFMSTIHKHIGIKVCDTNVWLQVLEMMLTGNQSAEKQLQLMLVKRDTTTDTGGNAPPTFSRKLRSVETGAAVDEAAKAGSIVHALESSFHRRLLPLPPLLSYSQRPQAVSGSGDLPSNGDTTGSTDAGADAGFEQGGGQLFRLEVVDEVRGVNLGGWFIPEIWMTPSFSNYTGLGWAGSLCK